MTRSMLLIMCCLGGFYCTQNTDADIFKPRQQAKAEIQATTKFEWLSPEQTGIQFVADITDEFRYNFLKDPYIYNGGGVAVLDVNNDGLQDLFFTERLQGCRLYLNKGGLKFEDISETSGVSKLIGLKTGVVVVDINADGWQDLYVCRTWLSPIPERSNLLWINNHDNTFSEQAAIYQLQNLGASQHANFFDYDLDGDLDCYVINHPVDFTTINNLDHPGSNARADSPRNEWESDRLFRNDRGKFVDVSRQAGIQNRAFGLSTICGDFNDDGWPDLFVGNDFIMPDFLYINNQKGGFTDQAGAYFRHTANHTMGADWADLNNDGFNDLIALDMLAQPLNRRLRLLNTMQRTRDQQMRAKGYGYQVMRNVVQISNQGQNFSDIGYLSGMYATEWSWAPLIADYDNDGHRDVFISNGIQRDLNDMDFFSYTADSINRTGGINQKRFPNYNDFIKLIPSEPVHNFMYQNTGNLGFQDVSMAWGFEKKGFSNGAAYADLDNDGDLDLITNKLQEPPAVYENKCIGRNDNQWLQVKLKGTAENPFGIGAKIRVYGGEDNSLIFSQEMTNVRGFYSSVEPIFQIGLGKSNIKSIELEWLEGKYQVLENVQSNQRLLLDIAAAQPGKLPKNNKTSPSWIRALPDKKGLNFVHLENSFEDFDREKLLPYRFSRRGPALSVGDLDQNGQADVFIGGAAGQSGVIYLQGNDGQFSPKTQTALDQDKNCEDIASAFFDADNDKDLDLFVVSGGNEAPAGSATYQDRLYLNDGKGNFSKASDAVPREFYAGSCVTPIDFNQDGLMDLVVGGGCVPGRFPLADGSMVLKNEAGRFTDVTATTAPFFQKIGMTTAIERADLDGDGVPELVLAGEWMPIQVMKWQGDKFELIQVNGLSQSEGIWRSLSVADLDNDGDQDIVAGNLGLNTRFSASENAPLLLFGADLDQNGSLDPIIAQAEEGVYHPMLQQDALALQIPSIRKRFNRNTRFAQTAIEEIFPEKALLSGLQLKVKTLASCWFEQQNGQFVLHQLPAQAQFSALEKALLFDFNQDKHLDVFIIGNDFGMEVETYRMDASDGCLLLGAGKGTFTPATSMIGAGQDARDAAIIDNKWLIVVNNNAPVQLFSLVSSTK